MIVRGFGTYLETANGVASCSPAKQTGNPCLIKPRWFAKIAASIINGRALSPALGYDEGGGYLE